MSEAQARAWEHVYWKCIELGLKIGSKKTAGISSVDCVVNFIQDLHKRANREKKVHWCTWKYDDDTDSYDSSCKQKWQFLDGTAHENGVIYCHHCGKKVKFK
jgi:hypothetical protein